MTNRNKRLIDKDHLFMTEDKEAVDEAAGQKVIGAKKRKIGGNANLRKKVLDG